MSDSEQDRDQGPHHDQGQPNVGEGVPQERPSGLTRRRAQHRREHEIAEEKQEEKARQADAEARRLAEAAHGGDPQQAPGPEGKPPKDRT